jgi:tRNA(fMet)-specific endonuclease VapC
MPTESRYLLDTNIITLLLRGNPPVALQNKLSQTNPTQRFICSVTVQEMMKGRLAQLSKAEAPKVKLELWRQHDIFLQTFEYLKALPTVLYDQPADAIFAGMSNSQKRKGASDCRIAACALSHGCVLVTKNTSDFAEIPGLVIEDWTI